jgi:hypothetical protein
MEPREIYVVRRTDTSEFRSNLNDFNANILLAVPFDSRDSADAYARAMLPWHALRLEVVRIRIEEKQAWLVASPTNTK